MFVVLFDEQFNVPYICNIICDICHKFWHNFVVKPLLKCKNNDLMSVFANSAIN